MTNVVRNGTELGDAQFMSPSLEAAIAAVSSLSESRLLELHEDHQAKRKSISIALRTGVARNLEMQGWKSDQSPFEGALAARATWQVSYSKTVSVVELAFGNREAVMRHAMMPIICMKRYWLRGGGVSTDATIIVPSDDLCSSGGFDGSYGTGVEVVEAAKVLTGLVDSTIAIVSIGALEEVQVLQYTGANNRKRSRTRRVR